MKHREQNTYIPISWLSKQDLLNSRPDLADQIQNLDENDLVQIGKKLSDALQETYELAVEITLLTYLGIEEEQD